MFARAARDAGVQRLVHISTAAVYERSPGVGDVNEESPLVTDDAPAYAVTKRDADAALADVDASTRVILRPPAILAPARHRSGTRSGRLISVTTRRPAMPSPSGASLGFTSTTSRHSPRTWHRGELRVPPTPRMARSRRVHCRQRRSERGHFHTVTAALGVEPVWEEAPVWIGRILARRAQGWGWIPTVDLPQALAEIDQGIRS